MKVTAKQLFDAAPFLGRLRTERFPNKVGIRVDRNLRLCFAELEPLQKRVNGILEKHGTPVPDDATRFTFTRAAAKAMNDEIEEMVKDHSFEIDIHLLSYDDLVVGNPPDVPMHDMTMSYDERTTSSWMFKEEEDEEAVDAPPAPEPASPEAKPRKPKK